MESCWICPDKACTCPASCRLWGTVVGFGIRKTGTAPITAVDAASGKCSSRTLRGAASLSTTTYSTRSHTTALASSAA
jgi:hypothetical protein